MQEHGAQRSAAAARGHASTSPACITSREAMIQLRFVSRVILSACTVLSAFMFSAVAIAQDAQAPEPKLNQPGKDVQWVPTPPALVEKMLDLAHVTAQDRFIDLGSG